MGVTRRKRRADHKVAGEAPKRSPLIRSTNPPAVRIRGAVWLLGVALAAATAVVYAGVGHHHFVTWDDPNYITANPQVLEGLTWRGVVWAFTTNHPPSWHPLTWISHMIDVQLFGTWAGGLLIVNVAFHISSTILLLILLWTLTGALERSAFVAGLFALHPLHVESVAWVAERKDVLSTFLWMLTLLAYVAYVRRPSAARYASVAAIFAAGLMAKSMLVTLPVVLLLVDIWPLGRIRLAFDSAKERIAWRQIVGEKLPLLALSIASTIVTIRTAPRESMGGLDALPLWFRVENSLVSYVEYLRKMLWPAGLAALYPLQPSLPAWRVLLSLVVLTCISLFVWRWARRRPYLAVGWAWYLVTLLPVIGLTQAGDQAMADRFMYVPSIGLSLMVAWGIPDLLEGWRVRDVVLRSLAVVVLACCAIVARYQVDYWENSHVLWQRVLEVTTNNHRAHNSLGNELLDEGNLDDAMRQYEEAERLQPAFADAHNGRGSVLAARGKLDDAMVEYREALRLKPDHARTHNNLGNLYYNLGRIDDALEQYTDATKNDPALPDAHNGLGAVYAAQGKTDEAIRAFETSLRLRPDADVYYNVATMTAQTGRTAEAREALRRALLLNPRHQQAQQMLANLSREP